MAANRQNVVVDNGLFNLPKASYSNETQQLLGTMMKESRLTNFQQRKLDKAVKDGNTLPPSCPPVSHANKPKPQKKKPIGKVLNPRNYSSQTRTRQQIEASGAYKQEEYRPAPFTKYNGVYEKDKSRLVNMMAYGQDIVPASESRPVRPPRREEYDDEPPVDRFQELEDEVAERRAFLAEMERLGRGAEHRTLIETQISQMVREMEIIDARRTDELHQMIAARNKTS